MNKSLSQVFAEDRYPYTAAVALGNGESLKVRYRASSDAQKIAAFKFMKERLTSLGLPGETALRVLEGEKVAPEQLAEFETAYAALGEDAAKQAKDAGALTRGFSLSQVIGNLSLLEGKDEYQIDDPINAETCAAFPEDVKKAIEALAASAQAPAEALSFFGQSPRF